MCCSWFPAYTELYVFVLFGDRNVPKIVCFFTFSSSIVNFMVGVMMLKTVSTSCILVALFL